MPPSPGLLTAGDLVAHARMSTPEAFRAFMGGPVLVGAPPKTGEEGGWSFKTVSHQVVTDHSLGVVLMEEDWVFALKKAAGASFAGTVLVGRAGSNDVCIPHPSISKLHARLRMGPAGELAIQDAGSSNGTSVNDKPLTGDVSVTLVDGASVVLGHCRFRYLSAEKLHKVLRRFP